MTLSTIKEVQEHKNSIESKGLFTSIIYFLSPITGEVEERHVYADDNAECVAWLEENHKFYTDKKIKHYGYNNGAKTHCYLNPFELIM
jgi:hypothetical protein